MKLSLLIVILLLLNRAVFSQGSCFGSSAVISPNISQPSQTTIVSSTCSALSVKWQGAASQTFCVSATYFNPSTNQTETVAGTNILCDGSQNCTATIPVIAGTNVTWRVEAKDAVSGMVSYPAISVLENPIPACSGIGVKFCGKVLLQGAFNISTGMMDNALNAQGILQAQAANQPYSHAAFGYPGSESVSAGFFAAHPDIVDWVLLELRDPNVPATVIATRAAFVKKDGTLVETDGANTQINFPGKATGYYHVAVRHRNHLGIRTSTPVDFSCGVACFDFTAGAYRGFQNQLYTSAIQVGTAWAMRGGNANANDELRYTGPSNDRAAILVALGSELNVLTGYYFFDLNLNGQVKYTGPGNDRAFLLASALDGNELLTRKQQISQ